MSAARQSAKKKQETDLPLYAASVFGKVDDTRKVGNGTIYVGGALFWLRTQLFLAPSFAPKSASRAFERCYLVRFCLSKFFYITTSFPPFPSPLSSPTPNA